MIKTLRAQLIAITILLICANSYASSPIAESWLYATILIKNEWDKGGTGFFVSRKVGEDKLRVFLCTNKHVLNKSKKEREKATKITCDLNIKDKDNKLQGKSFVLGLKRPDGTKIWKEHADKDIDVIAFDVTKFLVDHPEVKYKHVDYSSIADSTILSEHDITIGEEVFILGYPLGFKQGDTNFPILRQGIIASQIGTRYLEEIRDKKGNIIKTRVLRGFLIDGGLIPGSSGSPVVLKPVMGRRVHNIIQMAPAPMYLLGIVAETRYAPTKSRTLSFAGMGFAFDGKTIRETIDLFFAP